MAYDDNFHNPANDQESGIYVPVDTPRYNPNKEDAWGVWDPGTVGAGAFRPAGRSLKDVALGTGPRDANAYLVQLSGGPNPQEDYMPLWVQEVTMDFAAVGGTAQSRTKREFYHRHFNQPRINVSCQTFNQYQYNVTAKYIRMSHKRQIYLSTSKNVRLIELVIKKPSPRPNGTTKGEYSPLKVRGYIEQVEAGGQKGVVNPEVNFVFIVQDFLRPTRFADFDTLVKTTGLNDDAKYETNYRKTFGNFISDPNVDIPKPWQEPGSGGDSGNSRPQSPPVDKALMATPPEPNEIGADIFHMFEED